MTEVVLVNAQDQPIGTAEKLYAHQQGLLHRAFSVFILRKSATAVEFLLQQRHTQKYHGAGLWTNTCCSHPQPGEDTIAAGQRRLQEELGFTVSLREIGIFTYRAEFSNGLIENEVDHVLLGYFDEALTINPNPQEVMAYRWSSIPQAMQDYQVAPQHYTPWFAQALQIVNDYCS